MIAANDIIRREVERHGTVSFARFMELALYHPDAGYYEREKSPGKRGDFFTSVSVGNLFGELLAFQFAEWLEAELNNRHSDIRIIEAGAHDGRLARDILTWLKSNRPSIFDGVKYGIVEPSSRRRGWQKEMLAGFEDNILWLDDFKNLNPSGIIFSNELLDAMPVRRFGWDAKQGRWLEWGVACGGDRYVWEKISSFDCPPTIRNLPVSLLEVLPDNYTIEISTAADDWWRSAAAILEHGRLLTLDYGLTTEELFSPMRTGGTLRAYFQHRINDDVLANAGEQDITAHVNFSSIRKIGEESGFITEFFNSQTRFLTEILAKAAKGNSFVWDSGRTRQFQTLTHPEHLGRAFRVLVQSK